MKKFLIIVSLATVILVAAFFALSLYAQQQQADLLGGLQTSTLERAHISATIGSTGTVRSNQSAYLFWKTSGEVDQMLFSVGDQVAAESTLATLVESSLPPYLLLTQANLITVQRSLDSLLTSETQRALALKAVEEAEEALEQAQNPELALALAQGELATAQQALADAQYKYQILAAPTPQSAIEQAFANLILAQKELDDLLVQLENAQYKAIQNPDSYQPWENTDLYLRMVQGLEAQKLQLEIKLSQSTQRYNNLLLPPDPFELNTAEAQVLAAEARLNEAQREWERISAGPTVGEIAVLEAQLADAQREWERIKDGPDALDVSILETQIAALQSTLDTTQIVAPFAGTVTRVETQPGDQVTPGSLAFRIDDLSRILIDLQVTELDINRIQVGQPVLLTFDATLAKEYHGIVVEVALAGIEIFGSATFPVTVEILDADEFVRPGMTANVDITISEIEDALLVPNRAVRIIDDETVVYILSSGTAAAPVDAGPLARLRQFLAARVVGDFTIVPVPIQLGESSGLYSQILAGELQAGDTIVLNPSPMMITGPGMGGPPPFVRR